ncbi:1,4-alpha-glucan branching protein GlgB [Stenotrophomonas sp. 278]|nr:1,4-alpha-glucan branching protein GlgB [Stenotrophomonas sp. 278]
MMAGQGEAATVLAVAAETERDEQLLDEGLLRQLHQGSADAMRALGAVPLQHGGLDGVRFAVWAPNARHVAVVGDFNGWNGERHPMRKREVAGVWECFVPHVSAGERYKFRITGADGHQLPDKADPMARWAERAPATASRVPDATPFQWNDAAWMAQRAQWRQAPLSIYEVHAASWQRDAQGDVLDWQALGDRLIPHVQSLGFTHIELLPVSEHPFGGSWGYQPLGLYAPTSRHGTPADFARFVDRCHQAGIGVIVDWVGAHFPDDGHGLQRFDGTALYEHADPREGFHADWHTLIYNYGRHEVGAYLLGSVLEWVERFHLDGVRVDAVASMLYRDYSRREGEWIPNEHGGRENLQAVAFLRHMNGTLRARHPDVMLIAEESTAWPGVTAAPEHGGLGFTHKWNMGWMHDTLGYMQRDPAHRRWHHGEMTFGLVYAFSERYVLPLSHDEVVHGKGSLLQRMPGDDWQRFAQLRAYYAFMWAHPGSKLLFMGGEFGQAGEWRHDHALDWEQAGQPLNQGLVRLVSDLNGALRHQPACHSDEQNEQSFQWSIGDDAANSVFAFIRRDPSGAAAPVLVVCNLTPVVRHGYRIGVPQAGTWQELLNTDSGWYGGGNVGNGGAVPTEPVPLHGQAQSLVLTLPPLATLYLQVTA